MSKIKSYLNSIFNRNKTKYKRIELVTEKGEGFYSYNGLIFESDLIRACLRPKIKLVGKLNAKHIRKVYTDDGKSNLLINPEPYMRILLEDPNPFMSMQKLLEKSCAQLSINNNAFILVIRDENGYPIGLYPIPAITAECIYDKFGNLFLKFLMQNGKFFIFSYNDIIHLRSDYKDNDIFGTSLISSILPLIDIVSTTDKGIIKAIKNSNIIQWLLEYNNSLRPEDLTENAKRFAEDYMNISGNGMGVAATDAKAKITRIEPKDYVPNASQMDRTTKRIYSLFGTNEKIVMSNATEDENISYYEAEIEPIVIDLQNEFTRKLFTKRERGFGNKIVFEASSLSTASMSTKLGLKDMVDRGAMTPNEWREAFNLAPVEGGDNPIRRLDTAPVIEQKSIEREEKQE